MLPSQCLTTAQGTLLHFVNQIILSWEKDKNTDENSNETSSVFCFVYIPYVPVIGSWNSGICGAAKVNTANNTPIRQMTPKASHGRLHRKLFCLNSRVSRRNAPAAEMKNIAMLTQSGDLPITPL